VKRLLVALVVVLALSGSAQASVWVGENAVKPTLRVDAKGTAEVRFVSGGQADTVIVPARGQLYHGGSLSGPDVSTRVSAPKLPNAVVVKRTADGRLWALQRMQLKPGAPLDLHLARWRGKPTKIELQVNGGFVEGRATFNGRGVSGRSYTLEGKRPRIYVYLDYYAGGMWRRMLGVAPRADGTFALTLRPAWQKASRYRATVMGPNIGSSFAPDAETVIPAPRS
jgi:hypothetical protein